VAALSLATFEEPSPGMAGSAEFLVERIQHAPAALPGFDHGGFSHDRFRL
jgi:hypothetical protein